MNLSITTKQKLFIDATQFEVLFGGAAGGGKSHGQLIDTLLYALKYNGSKQLFLRRTFPDLDKSVIRSHLNFYPLDIYRYNGGNHVGRFVNGSIIDFGYLGSDNDVYQYQSAEYDVIRFDELTQFTEFQYLYMISRCRGANDFPKHIKSSTNPGGVGHAWVKKRFIDPAEPKTEIVDAKSGTTRIFIPSKVDDNVFLMKANPEYKRNLLMLPEDQQKALLYGDWNIFSGQYFSEWDPEIHVVKPFEIPADWRRYRAFDYGLDRLACYWIAVDSTRNCYFYREYCESDLTISQAAQAILERTPDGENIYQTLAPPDLWARSQESGKSRADLFYEYGLDISKASNDRVAGHMAIKELLKIREESGERFSAFHVFSTCRELISCLPQIQYDDRNPNDCATEPHDITHAVDGCRYFCVSWFTPSEDAGIPYVEYRPDWLEDWRNARSEAERNLIIKKHGGRPK